MTELVVGIIATLLGAGGAWGTLTYLIDRRDKKIEKPVTDARAYLQDTESITLSMGRSITAAERRAVAAERAAQFQTDRADRAERREAAVGERLEAALSTLSHHQEQMLEMMRDMEEMRVELESLRGNPTQP